MKRVLLIGDSICGGYCQKVTEKLGSDFEVFKVKDNCRFSAYTLNSVRFWLGLQPLPEVKEFFADPDIIHWNNGLWDVARLFGEDRCFCVCYGTFLHILEKILHYHIDSVSL